MHFQAYNLLTWLINGFGQCVIFFKNTGIGTGNCDSRKREKKVMTYSKSKDSLEVLALENMRHTTEYSLVIVISVQILTNRISNNNEEKRGAIFAWSSCTSIEKKF